MNDSLSIEFARIEDGFARIVISGTAGIGSEGNIHGKQIRGAIRDLNDRERPRGIIVDCCDLEYRYLLGIFSVGLGIADAACSSTNTLTAISD